MYHSLKNSRINGRRETPLTVVAENRKQSGKSLTMFPKDTENWKNWGVWQIICKSDHNKSSSPYMNTTFAMWLGHSSNALGSEGSFSTSGLWSCFHVLALANTITANVTEAKAWKALAHGALPCRVTRLASVTTEPAWVGLCRWGHPTPASRVAPGDSPALWGGHSKLIQPQLGFPNYRNHPQPTRRT